MSEGTAGASPLTSERHGDELEVRNPYTGERVGSVRLAPRDEIDAAFTAAAAAGEGTKLSRHERAEILEQIAALLSERSEALAELITSESGLCISDTRYELGRARDVFHFAAIEALRDDGRVYACDTSANGRDRRAQTLRIPVRLVAAISPFNHPLNQVAHKLAPAIAAGASMVLKPSERTPLAAVALAEIVREAGLPAGLGEVLCADPEDFLDAALDHEAVEVVSFTGGVEIGKSIAGRLGYRRAVLELGGNDPLIVLADADLDEAASLVVKGAFANSGQRCTAVKRVIAEDLIADQLADRVLVRTRKLVAGDPSDDRTDVGTVISEEAAASFCARVAEAVDGGAELLCGGTHEGALMAPTVLDHVRSDAELVRSETFGPVAPIIRVADLDEAIEVANSTPYALSSGVVTNDWRAIARCIRELRVGTVNVREVPGYRTELTPFGGVGDSGLGVKEGIEQAIAAMSYTRLYTLPWS